MRPVMLMLLLLAGAAFGQTWERPATPTEAAWHKLQILATEDLESLHERMAHHGVELTDVEKLRAYSEQSQKEVGDTARASIRKSCSNRAALENDQDLLIKAFEQLRADEDAAAAKVIERLPEVLGEAVARAFHHYVINLNQGQSMVGGVDYTAYVRSGKADVDRLCKIGEEQ